MAGLRLARTIAAVAMFAAAVFAAPAQAQPAEPYPSSRPIRFIVPFPPGGGAD